MFVLLCAAFAVALIGSVTWYALESAKDGYEDGTGFHIVSGTPDEFRANRAPKVPPFVATN